MVTFIGCAFALKVTYNKTPDYPILTNKCLLLVVLENPAELMIINLMCCVARACSGHPVPPQADLAAICRHLPHRLGETTE